MSINTLNPSQEELLARLRRSSKRRNRLKAQFHEADQEMRSDVKSCFAEDVPASKMTDVTELGGARLYQIRDGR